MTESRTSPSDLADRARYRAGLFFSIIGALVIGVSVGYGVGISRQRADFRPPVSDIEPKANIGGTAIANFGIAPVNPDWLQLAHKSGQPIDSIPSPEWTVITVPYEPKIEKLDQNGAPIWRITFEP